MSKDAWWRPLPVDPPGEGVSDLLWRILRERKAGAFAPDDESFYVDNSDLSFLDGVRLGRTAARSGPDDLVIEVLELQIAIRMHGAIELYRE